MNIDNRKDVFAVNASGATPGTPKEVWLQEYIKQARGAELYYEDTGSLNKTEYPIAEGDELYAIVVKSTSGIYTTIIASTSVAKQKYSAISRSDSTTVVELAVEITMANSKVSISNAYAITITATPTIAIASATCYIDQIWRIRV